LDGTQQNHIFQQQMSNYSPYIQENLTQGSNPFRR
jgi:hypothetical protein